jgi:two-component system, OmpR family, sensor histidine kinase CpxA
MRPRLPLFTKFLLVGALNFCLLGLVLLLFARVQFRLDTGSFLLAPAEHRIMALANTVSLELDESPSESWGRILTRYGEANGVTCRLFDEEGQLLAGPAAPVPPEVVERIPRRVRPRGGPRRDRPRPEAPPKKGRPRPEVQDAPPGQEGAAQEQREEPPKQDADKGRRPPPLFLTATARPAGYWAGVRIPLRRDRAENPKPATLLLTSSSLTASPLFFDPKPWLAAMAAVVLVSLACWVPFIRGMTQSISLMTKAAGQIAEGRFDVHVGDARRDEIGQLGEAINRMASRLAGFVHGQKRFLGGIAHELCTPIATIQFGLGTLERRVSEDQKDSVADIQEEIQHMSALVNELLSFSRAGMAGPEVKLAPVNVAATVGRAIEREAPAAQPVETSVDAGLTVLAEPEYLFRALSNLVRNAIRYAGHAGPIRISAKPSGGRVLITVADQGPGVPESALDEIFTPFYRLDPSRDQETGGMGLGLAIVKSCVEACRGVVRCRNRRPSGLEVEIDLEQAD